MRQIIRCFSSKQGDSARGLSVGSWMFPRFLVLVFLVACFCCAMIPAVHAQDDEIGYGEAAFYADTGTGHVAGAFTGTIEVNQLLGAERFYDAGFTGTNAVMANIEAGHIWNGHETLQHAGQIANTITGQVDRHATWVGMVMGGRPTVSNPGDYQRGMAPDAQLFSGAIATSWVGTRYSGSFNLLTSGSSTYLPYHRAFASGIAGPGGTRTADVVNSSFNTTFSGSITGTDTISGVIDALANQNPHTLFTAAVGNTGPPGTGAGPNKVLGPATGYNNIAVASLGPTSNGFTVVSTFSNGGPNNYSDPFNGTVGSARQIVDIAAPGDQIASAYYGGQTGGNGPTLTGAANGPAGGANYYSRSLRGTSFSSPTVAGGAALLHDAAYTMFPSNSDSHDARVLKATLMNSADKIPGWNNGQDPHPNGNGGVRTTQGLDNRVGAGRMNLDRAFDQYLGGTSDVPGTTLGNLGDVGAIGWDFGRVGQGFDNDYYIDPLLGASTQFTATLTWFRDRATVGTTSYVDLSYDNLNLELWSVEEGVPTDLIAESISRYNNSEHFSFALPAMGQYMLRVVWAEELFDQALDANEEFYGLAWAGVAVPEPAGLVLLITGVLAVRLRKPRSASPRGETENVAG